jgi:hypothetical protein
MRHGGSRRAGSQAGSGGLQAGFRQAGGSGGRQLGRGSGGLGRQLARLSARHLAQLGEATRISARLKRQLRQQLGDADQPDGVPTGVAIS